MRIDEARMDGGYLTVFAMQVDEANISASWDWLPGPARWLPQTLIGSHYFGPLRRPLLILLG